MPSSEASYAEVLKQLGALHRAVGKITAEIERTQDETADYREYTRALLENNALRLGAVETQIAAINMTIEKTVMPMVTDTEKSRLIRTAWFNRTAGFWAAWAMIVGILVSLASFSWDNIAKIIQRLTE